MKPINIIIALLVTVWLGLFGWGAWRVYEVFAIGRDPLRAEKLELQRAEILRETEKERQKTEEQKRETARTLARIERQTRLEQNKGVSFAAVVTAFFWKLSPVLAFVTLTTGAGLFYVFRRVPVKTPFVETMLPVRKASAIVEKSLTVSNSAEMAKAYAFQHDISQQQIHSAVEIFRSLKPGRESISINQSALPAAATEQQQSGHLPTFAEIFDSRELHGDMILGFEQDAPRLGKYEAVHSCLIYGLARSGKTSWLRGLIGQTILTEPETRCDVLDPHAARSDSLIGSLPKTKHFHAIDARDPEPALNAFGAELRRRLLSQEETFPPRILLIDELPALSRKPYAKSLQALCEVTSQEGRKVNCFLLATAQDLRQKKIGDFRESLSSAYFFKGKPNQVGLFLDDPDAEKLYRKNVNRHGVALFSAADEQPRLMSIPECKPNDLKRLELAEKIQADALPVTPQTTNGETAINDTENLSEAIETTTAQKTGVVLPFRRMKRDETPMERQTTEETAFLSDDEIRLILAQKIDSAEETLSGIAAKIGMNKGGVYRFLKENQIPSPTLRAALASFLGVSTMKQEA